MKKRNALLTVLAILLIPITGVTVTFAELTPKEELGKELFFDKLSSPDSMSCSDCHAPSVGFTGPNPGIY